MKRHIVLVLLLGVVFLSVGCNVEENLTEKIEENMPFYTINYDTFPYQGVIIKRQSDEWAGMMDVELSKGELWGIGCLYKYYGYENVERVLIFLTETPQKKFDKEIKGYENLIKRYEEILKLLRRMNKILSKI